MITALVCCFVFAQSGKKPPAPVPTFATLAAGQAITFDYRSQGCFHRDAYILQFRPMAGKRGRLLVSVTQNGSGAKRKLGEMVLAEDDVQRLDGLLKFYRERQKGASSTIDKIRVELRERDQVVATEDFEDATGLNMLSPELCRELGFPYRDVLTPSQIVRTLRERDTEKP